MRGNFAAFGLILDFGRVSEARAEQNSEGDKTMTSALIFPGQGSQKIGMGKALFDADSAARAVFEEVDDALSQKLSQLMFEGDIDELTLTENAQPALMAVSIAVMRVLEASGKSVADMASHVAGHSLGEYTALTAAGSFNLADAARLLKIRGQAMQKAVPVGEGAMAAVMGLSIQQVRDIASEASSQGVCVAANDNADGQVVLSGTKAAVEKACTLASEAGAKRALMLNVSAPFHSPLMQPAADAMAEALNGVAMQAPVVPVITNVTAAPETNPDALKALLVEQVTGAVRWRESVAAMAGLGIDGVVEVGAGKVLTGLARRINRDLSLTNIETPEDIETFLKA